MARWLAMALGLAFISGAVLLFVVTRGLPDTREIRALADSGRVTTIFDANDRPLFPVFKEERVEVPLSQISPDLTRAVIAVEDEHFYHHAGFDFPRIVAALVVDLKRGDRAQGGSTITQQLARKMFLNDSKTMWRKWRELALSVHIEHEFTKDKILELYLNKVYFGHGYYGAEAASRGYFGKPASGLSPDEAALLAGLIQAPSAYAPQAHPERALARREIVLKRMVDAGVLNRADADRLATQPIRLHDAPPADKFGRYFKSYVTRQLVQRFGEEQVFDGGLRVYSTIDPDVEGAAERALEEGLGRIEQLPGYKHPRLDRTRATLKNRAGSGGRDDSATPYLQGAIVAIDPTNGFIRALVGGRDFEESPYDRATQAQRQAGSAFKPFIYAAALETGYTPASVLSDLTSTPAVGTAWMPDEAHGAATPAMTVRAALRTSSNRAAVRMLSEVGVNQAVTYVKRLGFDTAPAVPSLALGTGNVSVLSLTEAYAAFANGGRVVDPVAIRRVENRSGEVLFQNTAAPRPAMSEGVAFLMAQMLADVVNAGTGYRVRQVGFTLPAGGKTGTTDDFHDAWFAGFTPALAATVWIGLDQPQRIIQDGFAGDLAAPVWGSFMRDATQNRGGTWIPQPADIVAIAVCKISGLLPGPKCEPATEYFRHGTEPTELCLAHGTIADVPGDVGSSLGDAVVGGLRGLPEPPIPPPSMPVPPAVPLPRGQSLPPPPPPRTVIPPPGPLPLPQSLPPPPPPRTSVPPSQLSLPGSTSLPVPPGRDRGDGRGRGGQ